MAETQRVQMARPRLEAQLDRIAEGGVALIAGSTGYGKSSAVAAWASRSPQPTRWIRGSTRLHHALELAVDEDDGARLPRLSRAIRRRHSLETCTAALSADLASPFGCMNLILDGVDALVATSEGLDFLRRIVERNPDTSRVVLIGRRNAALRLSMAESKRPIVEIGALDLRISPLQTRQIAESRGLTAEGNRLEQARRDAAGNGGAVAVWAAQASGALPGGELEDFIRRDVVGESAATLERLVSDAGDRPNEMALQCLWSEGLLIAPADRDELGSEQWQVPAMIAQALGIPQNVTGGEVQRRYIDAPQLQIQVTSRVAHIHDLGPLTLEVDGRVVEGAAIRPRSLALLLYLATRPRQTATREEVIDALWPDAEESAGLNSLNQAIFHLRRTIDPYYDEAAATNSATPYVRHEGEVVSLHPELVRFDSAILNERLDHSYPHARTEELEALLEGYRGPFGVELPFESWVATYRGSLEIGLLSLLERAVLAAYEMGDLDRAIDLSARAARIDPADGGLLERLAILLDEDGATVSAHRAARRALLLLDELSIAPNPQLRRISGGKGPSPQ